ncbi:MAG: 50S ribosomal protein L28 [Chloroflexota bacterium]
MAKCERCGKGTRSGHSVSHSNVRTKRTFKPNIQRVTVVENGRKVRKNLCAKCIKTISRV